MLAQLFESRPVRPRSPGGFAASVVVHALLAAGAVAATAGPHLSAPKPAQEPMTVYVAVPERRSEPAPTRGPATPTAPAVPVISVPVDVPTSIPPIDLTRTVTQTETPPQLVVDGTTSSGSGGITPLPSGSAYSAEQVEVAVSLDKRSTLPRFPQLLKDSGVEGAVRIRFVVDTLGRAELNTVEVMSATHPLFAAAFQAALPKMRFVAARVGDHRVRQLVEFPLEFRIVR